MVDSNIPAKNQEIRSFGINPEEKISENYETISVYKNILEDCKDIKTYGSDIWAGWLKEGRPMLE